MILPDVNVLLSAFRADTVTHAICRGYVDEITESRLSFALSTVILASVVRLSTNPRIFNPPSSVDDAVGFCEDLVCQPNAVFVHPGAEHWSLFSALCRETNATGNLVTDAWIAALALEWGCEVVTYDRDFSRFRGIRHRPPHRSH
ncbi:MAG: type II toxin-antitoxin system VapC family toxin [Hyphomicrobiales bacterium]